MDLLHSRYASPMDFMHLYIEQGRFGEFVSEIIELDFKRKREEAEKEEEHKWWTMYVHSMSDKSFEMWKREVLERSVKKEPETYSMTDEQVEATKQEAKGILKKISLK